MIVGDIIERNAALCGDLPGLIFEGRRYTHRAFAQRVYRVANALLARGIRPQERVAILARNSSEVLEIFGAGEVAGFIVVNINHRLSVPEVLAIWGDAQPCALFFEADFAPAAAALRAKFADIRLVACIGGNVADAEDYEALLAGVTDARPAARARPDDIAYLIYTSGTTGRPKGVMFQHAAMWEAARTFALESGAPEPITALIVMPLFHVGARIESMGFMFLGGTIVLHRTFDPVAVLDTVARERITAMHIAPVMVQRILDVPDRARFDVSSLNCVHYASAPMPVPLLRRAIEAFGPIFVQVYGMTECLGGTVLKAHQHKIDGSEAERRRLSSAGQPYVGTELRIERMDGSAAPPGEIGEVLIRTPALMKGYWNNTAATIEALRGGYMHTQDLGYLDGDGFLYVVDRKKDMIISGGENIYSWEVEEALRHHPAVAEVAVIAVPDPEWGEAVKACVVKHDGAATSADELIEYCRSRIASYKKPRSVDFVAALPRLFNGKIDKKALRAQYWQGHERQVS
jgi:acyl-CoA synthetase (AMP-forming)/AMP-acid ligase II